MRIVECKEKYEKQRFLQFRRDLYRREKTYVDNCYFMLAEIFAGKVRFARQMSMRPVIVEQDDATDYEDPFEQVERSIKYLKANF